MMNKVYENIIFDIGNVVLKWQPESILKTIFGVEDCSELLAKTFMSETWLAYDQGLISTTQLKTHLISQLKCDSETIDALLKEVISSLSPFPQMVDLIYSLKSQGYALHALTNMPNDIFMSLYKLNHFWFLFDSINVSAQLKLIKPDLQIFKAMLEKQNLNPHKTIFLDDSHANVIAASSLGIKSILVTSPTHAISELNLLLANF